MYCSTIKNIREQYFDRADVKKYFIPTTSTLETLLESLSLPLSWVNEAPKQSLNRRLSF